jgi:hypothetical protein
MTTEDSAVLLALHGQIQTLTDIQTRLQALRQIPARLLRPPAHLPLSLHDSTTIPPALRIQDLKDVAESLLSDVVQDALKAAKGSEKARGIVINDTKRGSRKRRLVLWLLLVIVFNCFVWDRRSLSPVSVKPYISFESSSSQTLSSSLWPPPTGPPFDEPPIRAQDLPQFIREFNKANAETPCRLRVYRPHSSAAPGVTLGSPVVVRFTIKDIMTVYVTLTDEGGGRGRGGDERGALIVETVTAFGPREQVFFPLTFSHDDTDFGLCSEATAFLFRVHFLPSSLATDSQDDRLRFARIFANARRKLRLTLRYRPFLRSGHRIYCSRTQASSSTNVLSVGVSSRLRAISRQSHGYGF